MGIRPSTTIADDYWEDRKVFISVPASRAYTGKDRCIVYLIHIRYQRYQWFEWKRFSEVVALHRRLRLGIAGFLGRFHRPSKRIFTFGLLKWVFVEREEKHVNMALSLSFDMYTMYFVLLSIFILCLI